MSFGGEGAEEQVEERLHIGDRWECQFENGVWRCSVDPRLSALPRVWVVQGPNFFDPLPARVGLAAFAARAAAAIDEAAEYARQSLYATGIEAGGGLVLDSAVVESWEDYKPWFRLSTSHQMVGVRMVRGRPTGVYCDHP
jgi:hypothetical protein